MNEVIQNSFAKKVADIVSAPLTNGKAFTSMARVIKYYADNNTVDLILTSGGTEIYRGSVPIIKNDPNNKTFYNSGDIVAVLFLFADTDMPMVLGKIDEQYTVDTKFKLQSTLINLP